MRSGGGEASGRRVLLLATITVLLPAASACAALHQTEVEQVAAVFGRAETDPAERCTLLAPATIAAVEHDESMTCAAALSQLELPGGTVESSEVWGDNAQVRLTDDTLFLTSTGEGWRVVAAGCRSRGDGPYLCRLEA